MSEFPQEWDFLFGVIVLLTSTIGIPANLLSFAYFKRRETRNTNNTYFKRIYRVITLNDLMICLAVLPTIEPAFSADRASRLFSLAWFCNVWSGVWWGLSQFSIFLVGLLSFSRLLLLRYPTLQLNPSLAYILPGACFSIMLLSFFSLLLSPLMFTAYFPDFMICSTSRFSRVNTSRLVTQRELDNGLAIMILYNIVPGLCIVQIGMSLLLSLIFLKLAEKASTSTSVKRQQKAAKTVMLMTLLYVVFNLPYQFVISLETRKLIETEDIGEITVQDYLENFIIKSTNSLFFNHYFTAVVYVICVSFNSMINPAVYFWRMTDFRRWVLRKINVRISNSEY